MDQEGENVYVLDALHFETLFLTLKDIMPTVQAHHSDTEIKLVKPLILNIYFRQFIHENVILWNLEYDKISYFV